MTAKDSRAIWLDLVNGLKSRYFTEDQLASQKEKLRRLKFARYGEIVNDKWFRWISYHYPALLKEFEVIRNGGKMEKTKIYPQNYKTNHYCYFTDTCSECGAFHPYRKYAGWQKREHVPMCYPANREKKQQLNLF